MSVRIRVDRERIAAELDAAQAEKASPEILATFGIPNDRDLASTAQR